MEKCFLRIGELERIINLDKYVEVYRAYDDKEEMPFRIILETNRELGLSKRTIGFKEKEEMDKIFTDILCRMGL